ncbi:MAG TPA: hypothetical protein VK864_18775, partial [Longimicrobiales bacterium]|nr:hypothetical protein [Longimicrobiales bacterium]
ISGNSARHAFLWHDGVMTDLGTLGGNSSQAQAINGAGQIVGYSELPGGFYHAVRWENGSITDLGQAVTPGPYSMASGINIRGDAVGFGYTATGMHAVVWRR